MARLSLAQQIAQIEATAPTEFDVDDAPIDAVDGEQSDDENVAAIREHYLDVGPSALRKAQDRVSDPKYAGVKTSRKQLMEESDGSVSEDAISTFDDGHVEHEDMEGGSSSEPESEEEGVPSDSDAEPDEEENEEVIPQKTPQEIPEPTDDIAAVLRKTREEDREKGKAVSRQMVIWDTLLDARIRLQRSMVAANRLPADLPPSDDYQESLAKMLEEGTLLSEELFELQENLLRANESITPPPRKRRKIMSQATSEYATYLRDATQASSALEHASHPHLVQTLSKWSSKIQAVAPSVLLPSNRNAFSKKSQSLKSAVQLIDENLADPTKMLSRTQVWRGKGELLGRPALAEGAEQDYKDSAIFDDTDFYQQMLRDIIDTQGGRGDDWMVVQKQKKAKKKVDTKASKGRKIRYEVHEKLQNFMVPVPVAGSWHNEQIDELFGSLLGKGFENALGSESNNLDQGDLGEALQGGFRLFG